MQPYDQFSALADATRGQIVRMLRERPQPVHELASAFDISRPAISRHLRVLKEAGLVVEARQGRENVYRLERKPLKLASDWLAAQLADLPARKSRKPRPVDPAPVAAAPAIVVAPATAIEPPAPVDAPPAIEPAAKPVRKKARPAPAAETQPSLFAQMEFEL